MYDTYVIYNRMKDKIYIGHTKDLIKRIEQHNNPNFTLYGKNAYTKVNNGTWELVYNVSFDTRKEAKRREAELKSSRGRNFIRTDILQQTGR
jgi:putative endonuclease